MMNMTDNAQKISGQVWQWYKQCRDTKKDNDEIIKIIKKYYAFEEISETTKSDIKPMKKQDIINNKTKENHEKVLI